MPRQGRGRLETQLQSRAPPGGRPKSEFQRREKPGSQLEPTTRRPPHKRSPPCRLSAASIRRKTRAYHSLLHGGRGQLHPEFLAQGNEARGVAGFEKKRGFHPRRQTGIVGRVSIVGPAEHLIWFSAKSVDNGNLVGAVGRVFGGKILECGVSRRAIGLRLLDQS